MKKTVLLMTLMLALCGAAQAAASISFQTKTHDFGNIKEEAVSVSYEFKFTNKGDAPLLILRAEASCGCTTPVFPKEPIGPGQTGTIKVTYNTVDRPNTFHKTITVFSNDPNAGNVVLTIQGFVIPKGENPEDTYPNNLQGLRLQRKNVPMLEARIGSIKTETVEMINSNKNAVVVQFSNIPKHLVVTASNTVLQPGQTGTITIKYLAAKAKDYGKREDYFYVYTDTKNKNNPLNRIFVTSNIVEDFSGLTPAEQAVAPIAEFSDNRLSLGALKRGSTKTTFVTLTNKGRTPLHIRKVVSDYDGLTASPSSATVAPGKSIKIHIKFNAGTFDGNVVQRFTVITNDPKSSVNRIFITAQVN